MGFAILKLALTAFVCTSLIHGFVKLLIREERRRHARARAIVREERNAFRALHGRYPSRQRDGYLAAIDWPKRLAGPVTYRGRRFADTEPVDAMVIRVRREGHA